MPHFLNNSLFKEGGKGRQIELKLKNSDQPTHQIDMDPSNQPTPIDKTSTVVPRRSTRV